MDVASPSMQGSRITVQAVLQRRAGAGHALVAAYTAYSGPHGAMVATALPMLTMAPRLRCFMPGSTRRVICARPGALKPGQALAW